MLGISSAPACTIGGDSDSKDLPGPGGPHHRVVEFQIPACHVNIGPIGFRLLPCLRGEPPPAGIVREHPHHTLREIVGVQRPSQVASATLLDHVRESTHIKPHARGATGHGFEHGIGEVVLSCGMNEQVGGLIERGKLGLIGNWSQIPDRDRQPSRNAAIGATEDYRFDWCGR